MDKNQNIEIKDFQKGYLTIPFDGDDLKEFIAGLLGTPQTIKKRIKGVFEIELKDLQNFHDLIEQRISQQNSGKLIELKTEVYYNDDSSVILNSYDQLIAYNEVKPIISEAVRLTWVYLIQFPTKKVPEKQEIEIMIISTPERNIIEDDDIPVVYPTLGQFRITIEHTDRTWGNDMETLVSNQIKSVTKKRKRWKVFCKKHSGTIGISGALLFLLTSLISIYFRTIVFNNTEVESVKKVSSATKDFSLKIDYILEYIAKNSQDLFFLKSQVFIVITILTAIILGVWITNLADIKEKSFLILTRNAKDNRDEQKSKSKKKVLLFFGSILLSIIIGIISNFVFGYVTGTL